MPDHVALTLDIISILFFIGGTLMLLWYVGSLSVPATDLTENTDDEAIKQAISLVSRAKKNIEIFDDGDKFPNSVYSNKEFAEKVRDKAENHGVRVECFFNERNVSDLLFVKKTADLDNVRIWVRKGEHKRPSSIHYKAVDREKVTHLSKHDLGSQNRKYQIVDCRNVGIFPWICFRLIFWIDYKQNKKNFDRFKLEASNA